MEKRGNNTPLAVHNFSGDSGLSTTTTTSPTSIGFTGANHFVRLVSVGQLPIFSRISLPDTATFANFSEE